MKASGLVKAARKIEEIAFENSGATFEVAGVFNADGARLDTRFEIRKITDADDNISYELWLSENAIIHYEPTNGLMIAVIRELNATGATVGYQSVAMGVRDLAPNQRLLVGDGTSSNVADGLYGDARDNALNAYDGVDIVYGGGGG